MKHLLSCLFAEWLIAAPISFSYADQRTVSEPNLQKRWGNPSGTKTSNMGAVAHSIHPPYSTPLTLTKQHRTNEDNIKLMTLYAE